ncbi:piggyBac transposable element-derived protein 3-like [Rhagoletis pomonella]|uniref:piggyBac transposable element-derived protein 3-like n=1 Tax=Rhagoletis pomonella TaxID=28610 RepID=UPI00177D19BA|nr:piggyBac transposable element-derived protein 3-like [Rhagoletis pomonella]
MHRRKALTENQMLDLLKEFSDLDDESVGDEIDSVEFTSKKRIEDEAQNYDTSTEENVEERDLSPINELPPAVREHVTTFSTPSSTKSEENVAQNSYFSVRVWRSIAGERVSTPIEAAEGNDDLANITEKIDVQWRHSRSNERIADFLFFPPVQLPTAVKSEYEYFQKYLPPQFFEDVSNFTNLYSVQKESNFQQTSPREIRLFALHCMMGILKIPRVAMFWEKGTALPIFTSNMTRNRFYVLRTHLHLVDTCLPPKNNDKFHRVRPIMDAIRRRLLENQLGETLCVDEQIIPFTGRLGMKQYIRGKPCPWGIKLYVLCGKSGMPYDFIAYQGSSTEIEPSLINKLGFGASITLQLRKRVPQDSTGHQVYTDNFFTTYSSILDKKENSSSWHNSYKSLSEPTSLHRCCNAKESSRLC